LHLVLRLRGGMWLNSWFASLINKTVVVFSFPISM
jgi:hypothetical protein